MMNEFQKRKMRRLAYKYLETSMWTYILEVDDKYKKPNQVDKMRHRAVQREAFKRAKREVLKLERMDD